MPIHPRDPSCQASSIQVSIISVKDGSAPPASTGLNACRRPLSHSASTVRGVRVRLRSQGPASSAVRARRPRAASVVEVTVVIRRPSARGARPGTLR